MIISHSKKFIFLKGKKTAGSSIQISLVRSLVSGDLATGPVMEGIKAGIYPPDWQKSFLSFRPQDFLNANPLNKSYERFLINTFGIYKEHVSAKKIKDYLGDEIWSRYFKFTFERNPFDRIVSLYFWRIRNLRKKPTFEQYVNALYENDKKFLKENNLSGRYSNLDYYLIDNDIAVDFIGQYDNLFSDFEYIHSKIGIKFDGWLPRLKSQSRPEETAFPDIANEQVTNKLKEIFSKEISLFGYKVPDRSR